MNTPEHQTSTQERTPVRLVDRSVLPSGTTIERVIVDDPSEHSETFLQTRQQLDMWNEQLQEMTDPLPPVFDKENHIIVPRNEISEEFYKDPSIVEWALLMPSARALYYLTHLDSKALPSGQPVSSVMTHFMREMDDGIGIRTRKNIASERIAKSIEGLYGEPAYCLSLACGAADLMLETVAKFQQNTHLTLVDVDPDALNMARTIADSQGLKEGENYTIEQENLIYTMIRSDDLVQKVGEESQQVVDAIGINEYFSDEIATRFLRNAYRCVKQGGSLVTANMLDDRPQMQINKTAIGWPNVYPRSVDAIMAMLEKAGLPLECTTITIPEDGIYAVVEVVKPYKEHLYAV